LDSELDYSEWALPTKFKVGLATSLNVRDIENFQAKWNMALTSGPTTASALNLRDYRDPFFPNVSGGVTITDVFGVTSKAPSIDKWALYKTFANSGGNTDPLNTTANGAFTADVNANLRNKLQNQFDVTEKVNSAYLMSTIKPTKQLSFIAGLRFEKTDTQGRSFDDKGNIPTLLALGYTTTQIENLMWLHDALGNRTTPNTTGLKTTMPAIGTTGTQFIDYIY
jgi:outer membrane receptor protein involved in Fe transport